MIFEKPICPLMSTPENQLECIERKCAIYNCDFDNCAFIAISTAISEISKSH